MNLIPQYQFFILLGLLAAGFGIGAWFFIDLQKKVKTLFGGEAAENEKDLLKNLARRVSKNEAKLEELEPRLKLVEEISKISVQKVGFLRFNPFNDTGGDQSFIAVWLDRKNNGLMISSLYMREGVRLYAKKVEDGKTKQQLSEEEKKLLEETINK